MTWQDGCCDKTHTFPTAPWSLGYIYHTQGSDRVDWNISREEDEEDKRGTKNPRQVWKEEMIKVRKKEQACSLKTSWQADVNVRSAHKQPLQCILILNPSALLNHACAWRLMNIHEGQGDRKTWRAKKGIVSHTYTCNYYRWVSFNWVKLYAVNACQESDRRVAAWTWMQTCTAIR